MQIYVTFKLRDSKKCNFFNFTSNSLVFNLFLLEYYQQREKKNKEVNA